jgi:hypothetical protein
MRKYICEGKDGMLCIFIHNKLLCGFPLGKNKLIDYERDANDMIVSGLRDNKNIKFQIYVYSHYIQEMYKKKIQNKYNEFEDYKLLVACVLALVKLQILDFDDVVSIFPKKKKRKITSLSLNM